MNTLLLKNYHNAFLYCKYDKLNKRISRYSLSRIKTSYDGYFIDIIFPKIFYVDQNLNRLLIYRNTTINIDDNKITMSFLKYNSILYEIKIYNNNILIFKKKYLRLTSYLDLDYNESIDFDFYTMIYDLWKNR
jgi:hypothetical protein